jgi:hypothetical protein
MQHVKREHHWTLVRQAHSFEIHKEGEGVKHDRDKEVNWLRVGPRENQV